MIELVSIILAYALYKAIQQSRDLVFVRVDGEYNIYRSKSTSIEYCEPRFDPGGY